MDEERMLECPNCGRLPPDPRGIIICPECGFDAEHAQ